MKDMIFDNHAAKHATRPSENITQTTDIVLYRSIVRVVAKGIQKVIVYTKFGSYYHFFTILSNPSIFETCGRTGELEDDASDCAGRALDGDTTASMAAISSRSL